MKHKVLKYDLIEAHFSGVELHPLKEIARLGLDNYYKAIPVSIGDCWFFCYKEWPEVELPGYIDWLELDDEEWPQLKKEIVENRQEMKRNFWYYFRWCIWAFFAIACVLLVAFALCKDDKDCLLFGLVSCILMQTTYTLNTKIDEK